MPRVGDDPLPRGDRSCGARAPAFAPNRISPKRNRRSAAQPARSGSRCRPRSGRRGPRARESMDKEEEREDPSTADLAMPRVGDDPLPRGDRSCGARAPAFAPNRISPKRNWRSAAQPARSGSRCRPRSGRRGPRARESMDKEEEREEPSTADLAMPRVGDDPLPRGDRSCGARAPAFAPNRISPKRNRRSAAQPARSGSRCRPRSGRRGPRARESMDKEEERERDPPLRATTRRSTGDPVPRRAGDRRHHHRPTRPSSIVAPNWNLLKRNRRRQPEPAGVVRRAAAQRDKDRERGRRKFGRESTA